MHDSSVGLRSIIGRKLIEQVDPFEETALVEHCKNPDQLGRGCSKDDKNELECHKRSYVAIVEAELISDDVICEIGSNLNFAIPIREGCWYGTISTPRLFVNNAAGWRSFKRGIFLKRPVGLVSTQIMPIP